MAPKKDEPLKLGDIQDRLSTMLFRASQAPNIFNYEPHAKQQAFHKMERQTRLYIGGNRSGKSVGGVVEDIWWSTGKHPYKRTPEPPVRGRVIAVDYKQGIEQIILPIFSQWLPMSELKGQSWSTAYAKGDRVLTLENGSTIEFMGYEQDLEKFAGTSRHFIHFDEEPPKSIYTENQARLVDTGGSAWLTMTPVEGMTWVYDDIYLKAKNGSDLFGVVEVDMTENPFLGQAEIDRFLSMLNADERKARIEGKFVNIGGLVFKKFSSDKHVVPLMRPPMDWEWYVSIDHGYNNPTAIYWHGVSPSGKVVTFSEHYQREWTIEQHATLIHSRNAAFGRIPDVYVGDPAMAQRTAVTGTSIFEEYGKYDIPILSGGNEVQSGITKMQGYIEAEDWHITENCPNLIWEIQRLRWKRWTNSKSADRNNRQEQPEKKDDHACDSCRYFFSLRPDLSHEGTEGRINRPRPPSAPPVDAATMAGDTDWHLSQMHTEWAQGDMAPIDEVLGGIW
jgi:phage terminase large subunit-like protein